MTIITEKRLLDAGYPVGLKVHNWINVIPVYCSIIKKHVKVEEWYRETARDSDIGLICQGSSGAILSALIADKLVSEGYDVKILHVKKENETSHSFSRPPVSKKTIAFVIDDQISFGNTVHRLCSQYPEINIKAIIVAGRVCDNDAGYNINLIRNAEHLYCMTYDK